MEPWDGENESKEFETDQGEPSHSPQPRPSVRIFVSSQSRRRKPSPPVDANQSNTTDRPDAASSSQKPPTVKVWVSQQRHKRRQSPSVQESAPSLAEGSFVPSVSGTYDSPMAIAPVPDERSPIPWDDEFDDDDELDERPGIRVLAAPKPKSGLLPFLLTLIFWGSLGTLVIGGGWVAFQLIINPGSISWMQWMFPDGMRGPLVADDTPQSLITIKAEATKAGVFLGEPLLLGNTGALMIPVSKQAAPCDVETIAPTCGPISELRVYRPFPDAQSNSGLFQLVDRLGVSGLEEYFVLAPIASTELSQGSTQRLPFTSASLIEGKTSSTGVWFQVSGTWERGSARLTYGQIISYNPQRERLETQLRWTSPANELPYWKDVTQGGSSELVVNQTLGLEPDFRVYRVKATSSKERSLRLEPITLDQPALKHQTYENALILARHGLWTPALQILQSIKDRSRGSSRWSPTAQAQLDVIRLHAAVTKAQADRTWASDSQQITALILDGRWAAALDRFRAALNDGQDMSTLLRDDSNTLGRRVDAAMRVNRYQMNVQAWGALRVAFQQGKRAAIAWLQAQQPKTAPSSNQAISISPQLQAILTLISRVAGTEDVSSHPSRLIGTVARLSSINPTDWITPAPDTHLTLEDQQAWYQIQVSRFHDGDRWWRSPFTNLGLPVLGIASELWDVMGLNNDAQLQLMTWTADGISQTTDATVKAIRFRNGAIQLLAVADLSSNAWSSADSTSIEVSDSSSNLSQSLAITANTLQWLDSVNTLTLDDLNQQQPALASRLLPNLWRSLYDAGQASGNSNPSTEEMLAEIGLWPVQLLDLTGNNQPEAIITFEPTSRRQASDTSSDSSTSTPSIPVRTLIFSDQGNLLYSDLGQGHGQTMVAIATIDSNSLPTLIIRTANAYMLKQWSPQAQRFQ